MRHRSRVGKLGGAGEVYGGGTEALGDVVATGEEELEGLLGGDFEQSAAGLGDDVEPAGGRDGGRGKVDADDVWGVVDGCAGGEAEGGGLAGLDFDEYDFVPHAGPGGEGDLLPSLVRGSEDGGAFEELVGFVEKPPGQGGGDEQSEQIDADEREDQTQEGDFIPADLGREELGVLIDVINDGDGGDDGNGREDTGKESTFEMGGDIHADIVLGGAGKCDMMAAGKAKL